LLVVEQRTERIVSEDDTVFGKQAVKAQLLLLYLVLLVGVEEDDVELLALALELLHERDG